MRATLWQGQAETSALIGTIVVAVFDEAGIPLDVVFTQEDLLAAATQSRRASDHDFLIIDCADGAPSDIERCVAIATQTTLAVHIIHPREEAVLAIERAVHRPLVWLPAPPAVDVLLDRLYALKAEVATAEARAERPVLTPREREVAALVAAGHANGEIAARLHVEKDTLKTHVRHIMRKLGVTTRGELIARYRGDQEADAQG